MSGAQLAASCARCSPKSAPRLSSRAAPATNIPKPQTRPSRRTSLRQAAYQAKEYLPAVLRAKLLRRDGRQSLPLPPPPPLPPRRPDDDDEEDLIDAYDGVTSEEALEPVAEEVEWLDYAKEEEEPRNGGGAVSNALSNATESSIRSYIGDDSVRGEAPGGHAKSVGGAEEVTATELLPPPPEGPPLPPLLTERDMDSQQALLRVCTPL